MNKKRNILLVEPRYKNKYPPIGLMKLATYHRNLGDNVVFFKGDLKDFVIENIYNEVLEKLKQIENDMDWEKQRTNIIRYIKTKNRYILEDILNGLTKNKPLLTECLNSYSDFYKKREYLKNPRWDRIYISTLFTFYWKITIEKVQGTRIPLENINLLISDENGIILYRKHISDSNPSPFASALSTIYPIAGNISGTVISNTSLPVNVNDDFNNYIGAIFVFIDLNNDEFLSTGDTIRIYGDIDGDDILDITAGNYFKVYDISGTNEFLKCHL